MSISPQRLIVQNTLHRTCMKYDKWRSLPRVTQDTIVRRIERNCFEIVIKDCVLAGIDRIFTEQRFVDRYSAIVYKLLCNLDVEGSVGSTYLIDRLIDGRADAYCAAGLSSVDMCPDASAAERDEIAVRQQQTAIVKVSHAHICPKCKANKTLPIKYQSRAADEDNSVSIRCVECSWVWRR